MLSGLVIGTATATLRHASMRGWRLLVVQPLLADGRTPDGDPVLAVDALGAGVGDGLRRMWPLGQTWATCGSGPTS